MMIVEMLKELGHRVVAEAGSLETAEPLARTSVFDLAVFDINVAGFNISPIGRSLRLEVCRSCSSAATDRLEGQRYLLTGRYYTSHS
jgi:CheY-like chemotaxis protein